MYNSPVIDEGDMIKSSSIYEEDDSVKSEKNKMREKIKKNNIINNNGNNVQKFSSFLNNMNDFDIIFNKNIISTKNIKQKIILEQNFNNQNRLKKITNAINSYVNNEIFKKKRNSSYG